MKLGNLRIEHKDEYSYLVCDMEAKFSDVKEIWFSVPTVFEKYLTDDVYDAFLVASLYPAMYYKEDICIDGKVSKKLHFNITRYIPSIVKAYRNEMEQVDIRVAGFANANQIEQGVGTGFSAGVDSFSTFVDHFVDEKDTEYKISSLFFFNVGSHGGGGEKARLKFHARYDLLKAFPKSVNLPYVPIDSNLFDFYLPKWEYDAGVFCRACAILVLQKCISKYFLSSSDSYSELMYTAFNPMTTDLAEMADVFLNPMLSTDKIEIITDGAQYSRTQKTEMIVKYPPVQEHLNVCVDHWNNHTTATNCGVCSKCLRTLIALESLGVLENFDKVFDIKKYKSIAYRHKCQLIQGYNKSIFNKDNVDYAKSHGIQMPTRLVAAVYLLPSTSKSYVKRAVKKVLRILHLYQ